MTNYEAPKVLLTNSGEGPYGNSGAPDPDEPYGYVIWDNNDGGSHSDLHFYIENLKKKYFLSATLTWQGKGDIISFYSINGSDGVTVTPGTNQLTISANLKGNDNEKVGVGFSAIFNKMGDVEVTEGYSGSYFKGYQQGYTGPDQGNFAFTINAT